MGANLKRLTWLVIIAPAIYLLIIWKNIPDIVPMHYDLHGTADRYGSKNELIIFVVILMVVNVVTFLLLSNMHRFDTKLKASENKDRMLRMGFIISVFISAIVCVLVFTTTQNGNAKFLGRFVLAAVGLLFSFIGNYMFSIKPNYFAGIRLPWTLKNEDNWRKTHLVAGKLWFAGGLLMVIISLVTPLLVGVISALIIILVITILPGVYSYRIHKEQNKIKS